MGYIRHRGESAVTIDKSRDDVYAALLSAGEAIGTIKEQSKLAGYVVIRTGMSLFPPRNPSTVRVSVKKTGDAQTEISFMSDSVDGIIGFGSAGKAIDNIIKELEVALDGPGS
jgi:hypothetical protein